jgi:hypothetical protein
MEEVLTVYARAKDPDRPLVCIDEFSKQLLGQVNDPKPMKPGRPAREDYEYVREGTVSGFMLASPLEGTREVYVAPDNRRTAVDYALAMEYLAGTVYPEAETIVVVQDNLNTHKIDSFYEAFDPAKARALIDRFEFHYTPKHGSWLNIAEIEISAVSRSCLSRRIADAEQFKREVTAYTTTKNKSPGPVRWQFTCDDARVKLKSLYPIL